MDGAYLRYFKRKRSGNGSGSCSTYFGGFAEPAEQYILELPPCKFGDACLQISDSMQHARAKLVEVGQAQPTVAGCTGYSKCIVRSLRSYQPDDWLHFLGTFSLFIL